MTRAFILLLSILAFGAASAESPTPGPKKPLAVEIYAPFPKYTREWAEKGIFGKGVAGMTINPKDGTVVGVYIIKSTGHKVLDDSALEAFRRWRFKPRGPSKIKIPISFGYPPPKDAKNLTMRWS